MEKIQELLAKLADNVPTKIQNKLKSLERLNVKLELAKKEHAEEPTDDSQEQLNSVLEYVDEVTNEIIDELQEAVEKAKPIVVVVPKEEEPVVVEPIVVPVIEPTQTQEVQNPEIKKEEEEKSSGIGWFGLITGVVLLAVTAGVVNTLKK